MRVINGVKKTQHQKHVRIDKESFVLGKSSRYTELGKLLCVFLALALHLTHNYRYMASLDFISVVKVSMIYQLLDLSCDDLGNKLRLILHKGRTGVRLRYRWHDAYLGIAVWRRGMIVLFAELKSVILNVAYTFAQIVKQLVKDIVNEVDNPLITSEIIRHKYRGIGEISFASKRRKARFHPREDPRICASEFVNTLLDISNHKPVGIGRDRLEYSVLQTVNVLVLIDVYRAIELSLIFCDVGFFAVLPKALVGVSFNVGELAYSAPYLLLPEELVKLLDYTVEYVELLVKTGVRDPPFLLAVEEEIVTHLNYLILEGRSDYFNGRKRVFF